MVHKVGIQTGILVAIAVLLRAPGALAEDDTAKAKSEFEAGSKLFKAKNYRGALPRFKKSYELSNHRPATIFALAHCEKALHIWDAAIKHFQEYLDASPGASNAADVRAILDQLEAEHGATAKRRPLKKPGAPPTPPSGGPPGAPLTPPPREDERMEDAAGPIPAPTGPARREAPTPPAAAPAQPLTTPVAPSSANERPPPPSPPAAAPSPTPDLNARPVEAPAPPLSAEASAPVEGRTVLESPAFWLIAGAIVVAGGAVALVLATHSSTPSPYGGSAGVVIEPR